MWLKKRNCIPFASSPLSASPSCPSPSPHSLDPIKTSSRDTPCIGRSLAFPDSDLFYKWLAGLLLTKHNGQVKTPPEVEADSTPSSRRPNPAAVRLSKNLQLQHHLLPNSSVNAFGSASSSSRAPPAQHPAHIPGAQAMFSASIRRQLTSVIQTRPESTESEGSGGKS